MHSRALAWTLIATASGAAALAYETVWLRRLSLVLGGSAGAATWTLAAFMAGLGVGGWLARCASRDPVRAARTYAALEVGAAAWALAFPAALDRTPDGLAMWLPLPAAMALGATWPVLARALRPSDAVGLYAANTAGAVLGTLATTFWALPALGVRGAEIGAAALGLAAGLAALAVPAWAGDVPPREVRPPAPLLLAAAVAGMAALGLEVVWMRLAAVALGATVQTFGLVLAVFLAMIALGAALGRRWPVDPRAGAAGGLLALGGLALLGAATWPWVPYGVGVAWHVLGPESLWVGQLLLSGIWMAGAPAASGLAFASLTRLASSTGTGSTAAWLYASNAVGSTGGALVVGLWALPALGPPACVAALALACGAVGVGLSPRAPMLAGCVALVGLIAVVPAWDARLYAVGVYLRISDFADPSADAIRRYADEGWDLLHYEHGATAAVAVGRSRRTGNVWLSINGKFDASTGDDMPTQELSAELPLSIATTARRVGVVGLASGVTAGTALRDPRVEQLVVFELEPAVVRASRHFDHVNGRPLDDPRTRLVVDDARAALRRDPERFDVLISEPSNPWITGVSSLFTQEYWEIAKGRLAEDGVFCQWVQLYGLGPEAFTGVVRTFAHVFGDVWVYETIEGSDVLLIAGPPPAGLLPVEPWLDPDGVRRLVGAGWLNTDDHPRVEWEAPRWLHYETAARNRAALDAAR